MGVIDERYDIRLAKESDISSIMNFIGTYWKSGHILSRDREYFEYEFLDDENVNFIIAVDRNTSKIEAILGFLKSSSDPEKKDIWGSFWKVNTEHDNEKMLGIELQKRVKELTGCRYHNGIGLNPHTAVPLVRLFLGNTVQKMRHYYMLNEEIEEYKIAVVQERKKSGRELKTGNISLIERFEDIPQKIFDAGREELPYKDEWYVEKKFFNNPRRNYLVYGIESDATTEAFFVARECEAQGRKVLRILDYYGNRSTIASVGNNLKALMNEHQYEYIDFYNWGYEEQYLMEAGFVEREKDATVIIPNYFEPFEQRNVDIWIHYEKEGARFFKADGDQDRANI